MPEPKEVKEVHELMKRLQDNKKVDPKEVAYYLTKAVGSKDSHGMWIKREDRKDEDSVSVVRVNHEKELVAMRMNNRKKR